MTPRVEGLRALGEALCCTTNLQSCDLIKCFAHSTNDIQLDHIAGIPDAAAFVIARYERPGDGRLLVVADSFGDEIGHDFVEYFAEVWMVHINTWDSLSPVDRVTRATALLQRFAGGRVLYVVHDAGVLRTELTRFGNVLFQR